MLSLLDIFVLLLTAMLAGVFNAIAGGGSFLTFPMLIVFGLPAVEANATSTVGLWFGVIASAYTYRQYLGGEQSEISQSQFWCLTLISVVGGTIGSLLLLRLPAQTFTQLVPYLMLIAVSLFTANPWLMAWLKAQGKTTHLSLAGAVGLQFVIAIYGGYFGGGASILMLAVMSFMSFRNWNVINGMKGWLGAVFNSIAIGLFIQAGKIIWLPGAVIAIGSSIGAYGGATIAQKISPRYLRWIVVIIAWAMTAYLFWKNWVDRGR